MAADIKSNRLDVCCTEFIANHQNDVLATNSLCNLHPEALKDLIAKSILPASSLLLAGAAPMQKQNTQNTSTFTDGTTLPFPPTLPQSMPLPSTLLSSLSPNLPSSLTYNLPSTLPSTLPLSLPPLATVLNEASDETKQDMTVKDMAVKAIEVTTKVMDKMKIDKDIIPAAGSLDTKEFLVV